MIRDLTQEIIIKQDEFLEFMYDNFILMFYIGIACIIFVLAFTTWIIKHQIQTKVLIVRTTTGEMVTAKENVGEGTVKIKKKLYKKRGEPIVMQSLLRPFRFYVLEEGSDYVISPNAFMPTITIVKNDDGEDTVEMSKQEIEENASTNLMYQKLLEAEVVEQSIRGLVGTTLEKIIFMLAGGTIFVFAWEIIKGIFGGG